MGFYILLLMVASGVVGALLDHYFERKVEAFLAKFHKASAPSTQK